MSGGTIRHRRVKAVLFGTDLGFLGYWVATALGVISVGSDPMLQQWNWSFLGLDIAAISLGLLSLLLSRMRAPAATPLLLVALALTSAAGLMALNFYILRGEFDLAWWAPNLWLFAFPIVAITLVLCPNPPELPRQRNEPSAPHLNE